MNRTKYTLSFLTAFLFIMTCASTGKAVAFRTFVAGPGIGDDANTTFDCSFTKPCRNFSVAYGVTSTGGEIVALSSAGYGGLTIGHAITIQAAPGQYAFIGVVAASAGITVTAGASEAVIIRNLQFSGSPGPLPAGSIGVQHNSGKLLIENCFFTALATGIQVNNSKADIVNTDILSNTVGVSTTGAGYDIGCSEQYPGAVTQVRVDRGSLSNNTTGFQMNSPGTILQPCFCSLCPGPTPTPSVNPTLNKVTIFLHSTDSTSSGITLNITGNTTYMNGTGASCTATPGMCQQAGTYAGQVNPK